MNLPNDVEPSKLKILVGMSDSVDSFVAAYLLKKQGVNVMALAIINWDEGRVGFEKKVGDQEVFEEIKAPRCHIKDISRIEKFCESIKVPLYVTDAKGEFSDKILMNAVNSKLCGKTYQTCFRCTKFKINVLYEKAQFLKCDYIATAHYAKVFKNHTSNEYFVYKSNDLENDQSYKLSSVSKDILAKLILPFSELKRAEVMKIAAKFNIDIQKSDEGNKKLCFVYDDNFIPFVESRTSSAIFLKGEMMDYQTKRGIGEHGGLHRFFEGQKDFVLNNNSREKYTVVDISENSKKVYLSLKPVSVQTFHLYECEYARELDRSKPLEIFVKVGFKEKLLACKVSFKNSKNCIVYLNEPQDDIYGNSLCVFYSSDKGTSRILGHGFIGFRGDIKLIDRVADFREEKNEDFSDRPFGF